jgi:hypothetical protein
MKEMDGKKHLNNFFKLNSLKKKMTFLGEEAKW